MKGCQSNSPASTKTDTEVLKMLFSEGKSCTFADCNLQKFVLDSFVFKKWVSKVEEGKNASLLCNGSASSREKHFSRAKPIAH